ncbi:unnamed protein product [Mytilus edulis]|uniref:G-protein coupled receptors family 2 profile 2 domain-containing protein n=1 Tax=Mytilus edulis TaxID=6550 RepID=A0A8S3SQ33_MYTED|nr:unnamed protein product [Mytilus edulis]
MGLKEHRTFWMPMLTDFRLLFLVMIFNSDFVVIGGNQEMQYTTSMVPVNSTLNTSSVFQRAEESVQDVTVSLLNSSYMLPGTVFKVSGSPVINPVLITGNQSELLKLISTISFDERPRDIFGNIFDMITDTTTSNRIKQYSLLHPEQYSTSNPKQHSTSNPKQYYTLNPKQYSSSNLTTDIEELVSLDVCRQYSSCEHVSNLTFKICHCDDLCLLYSDCCYDAYISGDSTVSNDLQFDCVSPIIALMPADKDDIFSFGPWVITDSNIVFKNRFCAKCNNISDYNSFDVKFTNAKDTATQNTPSIVLAALQDLYKERVKNSLVVEFIPPVDANLRQCVVTRKPKNESKHCLIYYTSPVFVTSDKDNALVRNTFCIDPEYTFLMCVGMVNPLGDTVFGFYDVFPMTVLFQFQQSCQGEFDVDGVCLARFYKKEYKQDYTLISSTELSNSMIEEILPIMAWSFSDEIKTYYIIYSNKVKRKVSYEESSNIDNKLKEAQWLIHVSRQNGLTYEVNAMCVKRNERSFSYNTRLNQLKVDIKDNFRKQLCAKSIITCESKRDSDNPTTVIKNLPCGIDFITYTGMGISVVALTTSILVYRRFGMHRSIPGSNVENLSIALLISDIIFMLGIGANDFSLVCYSLGVTLHYLWLLVFSFKCIALIHNSHNLTSMSLIAKDIDMSSKRPNFTLLGLLLPSLFVVPAVIIDVLEIQGVSIDYSGSICFPEDIRLPGTVDAVGNLTTKRIYREIRQRKQPLTSEREDSRVDQVDRH